MNDKTNRQGPDLTRRSILAGASAATVAGALGGALGLAGSRSDASPADPARPRRRVLIRGGHIITMDPSLGDIPQGDVLIKDGVIVAIGANLPHDDAEVIDATGQVVMPGMIDTHRHCWQTSMRALCADWTIGDYILGMRLTISPAYRAEDVYIGNYLGALDALNAGVTTVLDFSHCNNTPDHSDASVTGLRDAGIRAVYGYGFFNSSPGIRTHRNLASAQPTSPGSRTPISHRVMDY